MFRLTTAAIALLLLISMSPGQEARANPTDGMRVWGQVFVDGTLAPPGTRVEVLYGDMLCAATSVVEMQSETSNAPVTGYSVDLPFRESGGCGGPDQWLEFRVDGQEAGTVTWTAGADLRVNLAAGDVFFDLLSGAIVGGEDLAEDGQLTFTVGGRVCATVQAVSIGEGNLLFENVVLWGNTMQNPERCGKGGEEIGFSVDGQKLDVILGFSTLFPPVPWHNGEHFVLLAANPGGAVVTGKLLLDGEPAPPGTDIEAFSGSVSCGATELRSIDARLQAYIGGGTFVMGVGGAAAEGRPECVEEGAELRFKVNDGWANETLALDGSGVQALWLTVGESDYLPIGGQISGGAGLPRSGTVVAIKDGVECGSAPLITNEFGNRLFTDLIAHCETEDVYALDFFLDHRPLSISGISEVVGTLNYVLLRDESKPEFISGKVFVDGRPAEGGARVQAFVGRVLCGETSVRPPQSNELLRERGLYHVRIESELGREGCGVNGAEVRFMVDGRDANETASWQPGWYSDETLRLTVGTRELAVYRGTIQNNRENEGVVRAFVNGKECGAAPYSTNMYGTTAFNGLAVPSASEVAGCGQPGVAVEFRLDGQLEDERLRALEEPVLWSPDIQEHHVSLLLEGRARTGVVVDNFPIGLPATGEGLGPAAGPTHDPRFWGIAASLALAGAMTLATSGLRYRASRMTAKRRP